MNRPWIDPLESTTLESTTLESTTLGWTVLGVTVSCPDDSSGSAWKGRRPVRIGELLVLRFAPNQVAGQQRGQEDDGAGSGPAVGAAKRGRPFAAEYGVDPRLITSEGGAACSTGKGAATGRGAA